MPPTVDLTLVILAAEDPAVLASFYEAVTGWVRDVDSPVYVELRSPGGRRLGIYEVDAYLRNLGPGARAVPPPGGGTELSRTEVYLGCESVERSLATALGAGGRLLAAASAKPWGDTVAYVADPAGNICALAEPIR